ncbi:MAG: hypothetical protein NTW18_05735 [Candidatus Omnitrophica bacterium]|nr:hypothetical protein [Candidatus Omnitrophota bacterium]
MGKRNKFILLIIIGAVIFMVLRSINSHLNKVTSAVNEEVRAQEYSVNREPPVAIMEQGLSEVKPAVTIVGAVPVESRLSISVDQKREARVFQSQNSASNSLKQEELASTTPPLSGIVVNKEPAKGEKKRMSDTGVIIF